MVLNPAGAWIRWVGGPRAEAAREARAIMHRAMWQAAVCAVQRASPRQRTIMALRLFGFMLLVLGVFVLLTARHAGAAGSVCGVGAINGPLTVVLQRMGLATAGWTQLSINGTLALFFSLMAIDIARMIVERVGHWTLETMAPILFVSLAEQTVYTVLVTTAPVYFPALIANAIAVGSQYGSFGGTGFAGLSDTSPEAIQVQFLCIAGLTLNGLFQTPIPMWALLAPVIGLAIILLVLAGAILMGTFFLAIVEMNIVAGIAPVLFGFLGLRDTRGLGTKPLSMLVSIYLKLLIISALVGLTFAISILWTQSLVANPNELQQTIEVLAIAASSAAIAMATFAAPALVDRHLGGGPALTVAGALANVQTGAQAGSQIAGAVASGGASAGGSAAAGASGAASAAGAANGITGRGKP